MRRLPIAIAVGSMVINAPLAFLMVAAIGSRRRAPLEMIVILIGTPLFVLACVLSTYFLIDLACRCIGYFVRQRSHERAPRLCLRELGGVMVALSIIFSLAPILGAISLSIAASLLAAYIWLALNPRPRTTQNQNISQPWLWAICVAIQTAFLSYTFGGSRFSSIAGEPLQNMAFSALIGLASGTIGLVIALPLFSWWRK